MSSRYLPPKAAPTPVGNHDDDAHNQPDLVSPDPEYNVQNKRRRRDDDDAPVPKKRKREKVKNNKSKHQEGQDGEDNQDDEDQARLHSKHPTIFFKRAESMRISASIKAAAKTSIDGDDEDDGMVGGGDNHVHDIGPMPQPAVAPINRTAPTYATAPNWLEHPIRASQADRASFSSLGFDKDVCKRLAENGFEQALSIQKTTIPLLPALNGGRYSPLCRDILVSAGTGSGKTLAYALPMVRDLSQFQITRLRGLVILPTRELVEQVSHVLDICCTVFAANNPNRLKVGVAVGNQGVADEHTTLVRREEQFVSWDYKHDTNTEERFSWPSRIAMQRFGDEPPPSGYAYAYHSNVDILICTPGRLKQHLMDSKGFSLEHLRWIVLDEADRLFRAEQALPGLLRKLTTAQDVHLRKVIVGATLTHDLNSLSILKLRKPQMAVLEGVEPELADVVHPDASKKVVLPPSLAEHWIRVNDESIKPLYLLDLLQSTHIFGATGQKPSGSPSPSPSPTVLIFVRDNINASRLSFLLSSLSPALAPTLATLTSKTETSKRKKILSKFSRRKLSIIVASDLVSRGVDIPTLTHVINYDVPNSVESYVHRVGRTARADHEGSAWTLLGGKEIPWFKREILGVEDGNRKGDGGGLGIVRSRKVKRLTLMCSEGVSEAKENALQEALAKLEEAVNA